MEMHHYYITENVDEKPKVFYVDSLTPVCATMVVVGDVLRSKTTVRAERLESYSSLSGPTEWFRVGAGLGVGVYTHLHVVLSTVHVTTRSGRSLQ